MAIPFHPQHGLFAHAVVVAPIIGRDAAKGKENRYPWVIGQ
jgi:hypothetical protein